MKRVLLFFPFSIVTFLLGFAAFTLAISISDLDLLPSFDVPSVVRVQRSDQGATCTPESEEQMVKDVYSAVLDKNKFRDDLIVLEEFTNGGAILTNRAFTERDADAVQASTVADYELRNREPRSLREALVDRDDVVFYTEKDDRALDLDRNAAFKRKFVKRFPGSHRLLSISNVGFNTDHTEALLYFSYYCGPLCAGASFIVLKNTGNRWVVDYKIPLWVS